MIVPFLRELFTVSVVVYNTEKTSLLNKECGRFRRIFRKQNGHIKQGEQVVSNINMTILAENVPLWLKNVSGLVPANSQLCRTILGRIFSMLSRKLFPI